MGPDGNNFQFTQAFADNIAVVGPSGIVLKDGRNIQFTDDLHFARKKRSTGFVSAQGNIGHSGILRKDGTTDLFSHDLAHNIVLVGPSGIVGLDGKNVLFDAPAAPTVLLDGPSGQVMSDGRLIQKRAKRSAGYVLPAGNIGHSGILRTDGSTDLFSHDFAHNIVLIGPSGIVTKDGSNVQLSDDLRRVKRSLIGPSGMFWNGMPVQFSHEEGRLRSGLTPEQYSNAVVVGPSGIVGLDGKNVQFDAPAAPTVLLDGPSGQVTSDGRLIQKSA